MNVDTLISILLTFDKNQPVLFEDDRGSYNDIREIGEDWEVLVAEGKSWIKSPVVLRG